MRVSMTWVIRGGRRILCNLPRPVLSIFFQEYSIVVALAQLTKVPPNTIAAMQQFSPLFAQSSSHHSSWSLRDPCSERRTSSQERSRIPRCCSSHYSRSRSSSFGSENCRTPQFPQESRLPASHRTPSWSSSSPVGRAQIAMDSVLARYYLLFHHLPSALQEPLEFPSYSLGSVKAQTFKTNKQDAGERSSGGSWESRHRAL